MTTRTFSLILWNPKQPNETHVMLITNGSKGSFPWGVSTKDPTLLVNLTIIQEFGDVAKIQNFHAITNGMDKLVADELVQVAPAPDYSNTILGVTLRKGEFLDPNHSQTFLARTLRNKGQLCYLGDIKTSAKHPAMLTFLEEVSEELICQQARSKGFAVHR